MFHTVINATVNLR